MWITDQFLILIEHLRFAVRSINSDRLENRFDNPNQRDAGVEILANLVSNAFLGVRGRQYFDGERWDAVDAKNVLGEFVPRERERYRPDQSQPCCRDPDERERLLHPKGLRRAASVAPLPNCSAK